MTENVKHVESSLRELIERIMTADSRGVADPVASERFIRDHGRKLLSVLQREAAGGGECVARLTTHYGTRAFTAKIHDVSAKLPPGTYDLYTAPRPTGTEHFSICSEHRPPQPDCRRCNPFATTPASAEPTDFARGLAEHDAKLTGTGFLVDGGYVTPDRVQVITPNPDARGGGDVEFSSDTAALAFLRLIGNGNPNVDRAVERIRLSLIALSHPTPAALDAEEVTDEMVSAAWMAFTGRDKWGVNYAEDHKHMTAEERRDMRAALIAARATTGASE